MLLGVHWCYWWSLEKLVHRDGQGEGHISAGGMHLDGCAWVCGGSFPVEELPSACYSPFPKLVCLVGIQPFP